MRHFALAGVLCLALAPAVQAQEMAPMYPFPPVPPAQAEVMSLPPVSTEAQMWHPGFYAYDGKGYTWMSGSWMVRTPEMTGQWLPGHWEQLITGRHVHYTWMPGHWV